MKLILFYYASFMHVTKLKIKHVAIYVSRLNPQSVYGTLYDLALSDQQRPLVIVSLSLVQNNTNKADKLLVTLLS